MGSSFKVMLKKEGVILEKKEVYPLK